MTMEQPPVALAPSSDPTAAPPSFSVLPAGVPEITVQLRSAEFRHGREQSWLMLEDMIERIEKKGITSLTPQEVQDLPLLYRATMSSLSVARSIVLDRNLLLYLENLALRAYLAVYGPRTGMVDNFRRFVERDFPRWVRGMHWHLLLAAVLLFAGIVAGYLIVDADPASFSTLVGDSMAQGRGSNSSRQELRDIIFAPWSGFVDSFIVFSNFLFNHNTLVGLLCFGLGFCLGLPTLMLLIYNGLALGAFIAIHAHQGLTVDFIGWISIHGVTEILAVLLCAAAGFVVAEKICFPGALPRLESLAFYGRRAGAVAAGSVMLFFIAGILEGGFRQLVSNTPGRYAFALVTGALWLWYFTRGGRK